MRRPTLSDVARRRLERLPSVTASPKVLRAKVAFFDAVVDQDYARARAAFAVFAPAGPLRSSLPDAKTKQRVAALVKLVEALRAQRIAGAARPPSTPEQIEQGRATAVGFGRWLAGDDSAGPFE